MKNRIETTSLIIFLLMWVVIDYFVGQYFCQLVKESGAVVLVKDIVACYVFPLFIGWALIVMAWCYVCDKIG